MRVWGRRGHSRLHLEAFALLRTAWMNSIWLHRGFMMALD
jgi:hypothetical protein